jgi:hypothetical protein
LPAQQYKNFRVAVYMPVFVVSEMQDEKKLESSWETISRQVKVDKVYVETYRSHQIAEEQMLEKLKKFFKDRGVQVAGGIAFTGDEARQFESFCYTDPRDREYVKHVSELTALRRNYFGRFLFREFETRFRHRCEGEQKLDEFPTGPDGRCGTNVGDCTDESSESQGESHYQVSELVRAFSRSRFRFGPGAEVV